MSTQAEEPGKHAWWTDEDDHLGPVARLVDWVRWHRVWTVVIFLGLVLAVVFVVKLVTGGQSGNAEACTAYYNAQNYAAAGDMHDADEQIALIFDEAHRITSPALAQLVQTWEIGRNEGTIDPTSDTNPAIASACVKLGLGNTARN